ncbi:GNAT family N-acetyltransferase [Streptomyces sp. NPDC093085]|uniref:GNAT family N-acetyltransferase n=1 Tax=Streptomyces sp. NPDC093085 TaxID=3155068 RepID=UPI0034263A2F
MSLVRRATPADAAELVRLRKVMLDASHGPDPDTGWQPAALRTLRERLADPDGDLAAFVVDRPARPSRPGDGAGARDRTEPTAPEDTPPPLVSCAVGTIEHRLGSPGDPSGAGGHLFNVATDPDARRQGHSRACVAALLEWYRTRGIRKIDLHATPEAEPLYISLGFTRTTAPAMRLRRIR